MITLEKNEAEGILTLLWETRNSNRTVGEIAKVALILQKRIETSEQKKIAPKIGRAPFRKVEK